MVNKKVNIDPKRNAGGNPYIDKGDGDAPVQAYIAAMPGWKQALGRQLDALVTREVPGLQKAVRWNTPFYGVEGKGWFLAMYCYKKYFQISFLNGSQLDPLPPKESKDKSVRYLDIYEDDGFDEERIASWIKQAAKLPGDNVF